MVAGGGGVGGGDRKASPGGGRKSGVEGKRVDLGGGRIIKKKKKIIQLMKVGVITMHNHTGVCVHMVYIFLRLGQFIVSCAFNVHLDNLVYNNIVIYCVTLL